MCCAGTPIGIEPELMTASWKRRMSKCPPRSLFLVRNPSLQVSKYDLLQALPLGRRRSPGPPVGFCERMCGRDLSHLPYATTPLAWVALMLLSRSSATVRRLDSSAAARCQATSDPGVAGQWRRAIKGVAREDIPVAAATGPHPPDSRSRLPYFDRPPSVERARTQRSRNVRPECAGAVEHHFLHGISFLRFSLRLQPVRV